GVLAMVARRRPGGSLLLRRPAIESRQRGVGATFVDQDELLGVERGRGRPPGCARLLVAHSTAASVFFSASTPSGEWPATSSLHSTAGPGAPPTRRRAPAPWHRIPLPAAPAGSTPARARYGAGSREWAGAPASPSRAAAPRRVCPWSRRR